MPKYKREKGDPTSSSIAIRKFQKANNIPKETLTPAETIGQEQPPAEATPRKTTHAERVRRVSIVIRMLLEGRRTGEVKKYCQKHWGIRHTQALRYVRYARDELMRQTGQPKEQLQADSFAWYLSVLRSTKAKVSDKISARKAADELMGLQAPKLIAQTTSTGEDLMDAVIDRMSVADLEALNRMAEAAETVEREEAERKRLEDGNVVDAEFTTKPRQS